MMSKKNRVVKERALFAGTTDYTAVPFSDILQHLQDWKNSTDEVIAFLQQKHVILGQNQSRFTNPKEVDRYITSFIEAFKRYSDDFTRLLRELPKGVSHSHTETVRQIQQNAYEKDRWCQNLRQGIYTADVELEYSLIEPVYNECRTLIHDYLDLSNLASRLEALEGFKPSPTIWKFLFGSARKIFAWICITIVVPLLIAWLIKSLNL